MLRQRLKDETWDLHQRAEAAMDLMNPQMNRDGYKQILKALYAFYSSLEPVLAKTEFYSSRAKLPWIKADLQALGVSQSELELIPQLSIADHELNPTTSWGAIYVIEGSMLGGQIIMKHQSKALNLDETGGMRFFAGNGADTGRKWQETIARLNEISNDETDDAVIATAKWTFQKMMEALENQRAN